MKQCTVGGLLMPALLLLSLLGCETSFDPFVESENAYTILGFLDTHNDTQFVRVVPLREVVDNSLPTEIDAQVTSTDLTGGSSIMWRDSLVKFNNGTYGHVFWAPFTALPQHRYRLEVRRSDGKKTWAETLVPPYPGDTSKVYGVGNESVYFAPLFWPGVRNVIDVDVEYYVGVGKCDLHAPPVADAKRVRIRYVGDERGYAVNDNEWRVEFRLREDQKIVRGIVQKAPNLAAEECAILYSLKMRVATPSEDWRPPGGVWDLEVLAQPDAMSNVEGGFGYLGSVARTEVQWMLAAIALQEIGYFDYIGPRV